MQRTLRTIILIAAVIIGSGSAWGGKIYTDVKGGSIILTYFIDTGENPLLETIIPGTDEVPAGTTVYMQVRPDGIHMPLTSISGTLSASATSAQARRRTGSNGPAIGNITISTNDTGYYYFTMPADANTNVTITATFPEKVKEGDVPFIEENGAEAGTTTVYVLDGSETTLDNEWYIAPTGGISYNHGLIIDGATILILRDGETMTVSGTLGTAGNSLTVYSQSGGTGLLSATTYAGTVSLPYRYVAFSDYDNRLASIVAKGEYSENLSALNGKTLRPLIGQLVSTTDANIQFGTIDGQGIWTDKAYDFRTGSGQDYTYYYIYKSGDKVGLNYASTPADGTSIGYTVTGATLDAFDYYGGTNGTLQNADGHFAAFTMPTGDVSVSTSVNPFLLPGGYCGKSDVNGGKNLVWTMTASGVISNYGSIPVTVNIKQNPDVTDTNADFSMSDYTLDGSNKTNAPWNVLANVMWNKLGNGITVYPTIAAANIVNGVKTIGINAFRYSSIRGTLSIPASVTSIGSAAFEYCNNLTSVIIPGAKDADGKALTIIGGTAFGHNGNLIEVTLDDGVKTISSCAFESTGLTAVTIPASVTSIGGNAFTGCQSLKTVTMLGDNPPTLGNYFGNAPFLNCNNLAAIIVPNETAYATYKSTATWNGTAAGDNDNKTNYTSLLAPQTITLNVGQSGWATYCHSYPVGYTTKPYTDAENSGKPALNTVTGIANDAVTIGDATMSFTYQIAVGVGTESYHIEDKTDTYPNTLAPYTPALVSYDPEKANGTVTLTVDPRTTTKVTTPNAIAETLPSVVPDGSAWDGYEYVSYNSTLGIAEAYTDNAAFWFYGNAGSTTFLDNGENALIFPFGTANATVQSYILNGGQFVMADNKSKGIAPHRCWLNVSKSNGGNARRLSIGGEVTEVKEVKEVKGVKDITNDAWYSLDGRRLNQAPTRPGLYIRADGRMQYATTKR